MQFYVNEAKKKLYIWTVISQFTHSNIEFSYVWPMAIPTKFSTTDTYQINLLYFLPHFKFWTFRISNSVFRSVLFLYSLVVLLSSNGGNAFICICEFWKFYEKSVSLIWVWIDTAYAPNTVHIEYWMSYLIMFLTHSKKWTSPIPVIEL